MTSERSTGTVADGDRIADVYRATPLQEGMLFHSLLAPGSGAYLNQQSYTLQGELDVAAFRSAFMQMIERHPVLRTAFVLDAAGKPQQVVQRTAELPWEQLDWRDVPAAEHEPRIAELLRVGRTRDFDLTRPPLITLMLIRRDDTLYQFIWRYHLMLLDGWSVAVIFGEVLAIYDAAIRGVPSTLDAPKPYRSYIDWLERQDRSRGEAYWRSTLSGFATPTPLCSDRANGDASPPEDDVYCEVESQIAEPEVRDLRAFARRHRLTPNTVVMGCWALNLARSSGADDVVFGSVFAGRPVELPGIETMVGLFINNLPVRVRVAPEMQIVPWLRSLQDQQSEARQFEYMSLLDIQPWSDVPRGTLMFESVLIFQNYPFKASLETVSGNLRLLAASSVERNSYPITVVIEPGPRFTLRVTYDSRRFDRATVVRLMDRFRQVVVGVSAGDQQTLAIVGRAPTAARRQQIDGFNQPLASWSARPPRK